MGTRSIVSSLADLLGSFTAPLGRGGLGLGESRRHRRLHGTDTIQDRGAGAHQTDTAEQAQCQVRRSLPCGYGKAFANGDVTRRHAPRTHYHEE
jgi:hypothetical protein